MNQLYNYKVGGDTSWTVDVVIAINTIYQSQPHGFEGSCDITTGKGDAEVHWIQGLNLQGAN